jgi:polyisoprenoid-binding protein YceI
MSPAGSVGGSTRSLNSEKLTMPRALFALALVAVLALTASAAEVKYALTGDNTALTFVGKKPDGKHEGGFKKLAGTATVTDGKIETLKAEVDIDADSLYSDDAKLTTHLKSPDFFDVKNNPKATFKITKVEKGDKTYTVTGDLTLLGKTKPVSFPATVTATGDALTVTASFSIDRTTWGMNYGKGKIEDKVELGLKVTAKK